MFVGSLDVKALYPSIDIQAAAKVMTELYIEGNYEIEGADHKEIGLYLALNKTSEELQKEGLQEYCPKRKYTKGAHPKMKGCAHTESDQEKRFAPWILPTKEPDKNTKKCLVEEALKIAVIFIMKNHVYEFEGKIII